MHCHRLAREESKRHHGWATVLVEVDNRSAVDVGTRSIHVKKPRFSEAFPGAVIREGVDELTLRAEVVGMQRAFIDTKHIELERWDRLWMRTGTPSVMPLTKESKERNGKLCTVTTES